MAKLADIIRAEIRKKGAITFRDFMEMALYYPGLGYYTSGRERIGRSGDYYTSPHVSRVFGELIAVQLKEMWEILEQEDFAVVEMGAGKLFSGIGCCSPTWIHHRSQSEFDRSHVRTTQRNQELPGLSEKVSPA